MPDELKPSSPAPVHQLVGQLRDLLDRCGPLPWSVSPDDPSEVCEIRNKHDPREADPLVAESLWHKDATLIVAAVNALPALLAIAEAADQWTRSSDYESREAHLSRLRRALRSLPNAQGQPAATEPAQQAGRGPLGCADLLGADHQPEKK
jgi:hypothetical protein